MLKKININLNVLILLGSIVLNHIFLISSNMNILSKGSIIIFIFFSLFYFFKFKENKILFLFIILLLIISLGTPTTAWDARSIWLLKAKIIFYDQSILGINENSPDFSNLKYPIIAPAFAASFLKLIGYWNEIFPKATFTLMFIPPLIIINKLMGKNYFLLIIITILFIVGKYLINGELDGLLSIYFVTSALMFYNLNVKIDSYIYISILILLNIILTLLKVEGSILLFSLVISSLIVFFDNIEKCKKIILISILSFVPALIWNIFCFYNSSDSTSLNNLFMFENLNSRIFYLKNYVIIFEHLMLNEKFLISLFLLFLSLYFFKNHKVSFLTFYTAIIYLFFLFIIYLSTSLDLEWHLNSASRVIKPLALFFSIFSIYNLLNRNILK